MRPTRGIRRSSSSPSLPHEDYRSQYYEDNRSQSSNSRAHRRQSSPSIANGYHTQQLVVVEEDLECSYRDDRVSGSYRNNRHSDRLSRSETSRSIHHHDDRVSDGRRYSSNRHSDKLSRSETSRSVQHGGQLDLYNDRQLTSFQARRDPRKSLHDTIELLNLPRGMLASVSQTYSAVASRLYIVDNSLAMHLPEGHVAELLPSGEVQGRDASLWVEVKDFITFQATLGARNAMRTYVWLLNESSNANIPQKYALSRKGFDQKELDHFEDCLNSANPERRECPLASRLYNLVKCVAKEKYNLERTGKHIVITVCTQGMPTDKEGYTDRHDVQADFHKTMQRICDMKLPIKIIFRLCSDKEDVLEIYNSWDGKLGDVDVLDDFWGEALEVYLHNPWLTYTNGLHRLRESGLAPDIFEDLDERKFTADEIFETCTILFGNLIPLPHPHKSWSKFIRVLKEVVGREERQWNPIHKRFTSWIDVRRLDSMYGAKSKSEPSASACGDPPSSNPQYGGSFRRLSVDPLGGSFRRSNSQSDPSFDTEGHHATDPRSDPKGFEPSANAVPKQSSPTNLQEALRAWSHPSVDSKKLNALQTLLVTVPTILPPENLFVEAHEYFKKWKTLDESTFTGMDEEQLMDLLKRAARKAKFFLHPDKRPKDLDGDQSLLLKTIWDVIQEGAEKEGI